MKNDYNTISKIQELEKEINLLKIIIKRQNQTMNRLINHFILDDSVQPENNMK